MILLRKLEKSLDFWFLLFSSFFFFLLRLPSLFEPYWYGDEGIYQTIGLALSRGAVLYRDTWDNKPPAIYYLNSFFSSDQFTIRLISLIIGLIGVAFFFLLARKILVRSILARGVTLLFIILFGLPLLEGNIANAENFMVPINIIAAYLIYTTVRSKKDQKKLLILPGLLLGISFLFKIVSIFDFGAFFVFLFIYDFSDRLTLQSIKNQILRKIPHLLTFSVSFLIPFLLTAAYFASQHIFSLFLTSMFFSNIGYVGYGNKFIIPQGLLIFKVSLLGLSLLLIFLRRNYLKFTSSVFVLTWFSFSLFNAFFSQRPYPHYVLVIIPSLCLVLGLMFSYKRFSKLIGAVFLLSVFIILNYFSLYFKVFQYYTNFVKFTFDHTRVIPYQAFFDSVTPRDYEIATLINMNIKQNDNIFVWGNNVAIYKLTNRIPPGKYTALYHMTTYPDGISDTKRGLTKSNPRFIILTGNTPYPFSLYNYKVKIKIRDAIIYERNI